MNPDVSIIITTYNYEIYIRECIESCLHQEGGCAYEVVVVDDGSTDQTLARAKSITSSRLRVVAQSNRGIENASNTGIAEARGEWIVRVDADDRLSSRYLQRMLTSIRNEDFLYSDYNIINKDGGQIRQVSLPDFDPSEIRQRGDFLATGTLYRKTVVARMGGYCELVQNCGLENYEMILNMLALGMKGRCIHDFLFDYRLHGENISTTRRDKIIQYGRDLAAKFELGEYRTNKYHPYGLQL